MSLGKRISALRTEKRLSQGDLAEKLEVSRQSVSKWETDSSVPDLDKLVKLSEVFGVSLDELVLGEKKQEAAAEAPPVQTQQVVVIQREKTPKNVIAAWGFFGLAALAFLGITIVAGPFGGLLYALPFIILGSICLLVKKYTGVTVAWVLYLMLDAFFLLATGIRWQSIRYTFQWTEHMNYLRLAFAWVLFFVMAALLLYTIWSFRKVPFERSKKHIILLLAGWVLYFLLGWTIPVDWYIEHRWIYYLACLREWIRTGLLAALLSRSIAIVRGR